MNLNIFLTILFTSGLFIILKTFGTKGIDNFQAIVINYFVAASCSLVNNFGTNISHLHDCLSFIGISFSIGLLFILVFLLTAKVTQQSGVGIASVASKLSMVIPVTMGVFLYKEGMGMQKIAGLVLALIAVFLINMQSPGGKEKKENIFILPFILFIGCGLVDTSIKFSQHYYISENNRQLFIMCLFASAGIAGFIKLMYDIIINHNKILLKNIAGGITLGICNYLSLLFLIRSFEYPGAESSKVFAMVNLGVVIVCTCWAVLVYKEKLNSFKITGIIISLAAIFILYFI